MSNSFQKPPFPFEHRRSDEDIIAYNNAIEHDSVRELFRKWAEEDDAADIRSAQDAAIRLKENTRDKNMTDILSVLDSLNNKNNTTASAPQEKKFISVKEVAELLGRSEKTIRRWTEREHFPLPVIKKICEKQSTWVFDKDEVLSWFNEFKR